MRRGVIGVWVSGFCAGCLLVEVGLVLVDGQPLSVLIVPALSQGLGIFTALAVGLSSLDRADSKEP